MLPQTRSVLGRPGEHPGDGGDDSLQGLAAARVSAAPQGPWEGGAPFSGWCWRSLRGLFVEAELPSYGKVCTLPQKAALTPLGGAFLLAFRKAK